MARGLTHYNAKAKSDRMATLRLSFQQTPKKWPDLKRKPPVMWGDFEWHSACTPSSLAPERNRHDLKDRERFGWRDDHYTVDWSHSAGAHRGVDSANKVRSDQCHTRLERRQSSRFGCHSLPRHMSDRRYLPRPLFSLYK